VDLAFDPTTGLISPLFQGIFQGCAYGLLGLGLVLLYKSNRIFNFAQGEFAGVAALVAYFLDNGKLFFPQVPYPVAIVGGIAAAVLVALLTERLVVRPMFSRPRVVLVVGTVGVALLLIALEGLANKDIAALRPIDQVLGIDPFAFHVGRVPILWSDLLKLFVLVALAIAAFVFFRLSPLGTAILAVSQDATAARAVGISVERISMLSWGLAGFCGGMAGVLLAVPPFSTTPGIFTGTILTTAFAAAVLGGITSLPGAFVGGILMGLVQSFASADLRLVPGLGSIKGSGELAVAVFLLAVLLFRPRGLLGSEA
jgi:branched-chain amino acid transport system permease protein